MEPSPGHSPKESSAVTMDTKEDASDLVDAKIVLKKIFTTRKKASVRAREKRIRQNRRLRKTIIPKNALMALRELKGVSFGEITIKSNPEGGFIALVTVNNKQFEGRGKSKVLSKNSACEKALRDYIIAKMRENPRLGKGASNNNLGSSESMDTSEGNENGNENDVKDGGDDVDDVPMVNLASFALYKLFTEWENEGFIIPEMHSATTVATSDNDVPATKIEKKSNRDELPENWESMQPAALLKLMRPGVVYEYRGSTGERPNMLQTLAVKIDEQEFVAQGRPKRFARRNVAALACNTLFNTTFELDAKVEDTEDTATPVEK